MHVLLFLLACAEPSQENDTACEPSEELPYDGVDQDCDGADLDDVDGDGFALDQDCDDQDAERYPGAEELPYDGVDQDCDGADLDDVDGDGFALEQDCDDDDARIHPLASELCDAVDQDCDGQVDEHAADALTGFLDADLDGYGDPEKPWTDCASLGPSLGEDCDDSDPRVYPGATERCSGVDNNCDGLVDTMVAGVTHSSVQEALDAACEDGDTVWVAPGTYYENIVINRPVTLRASTSAEETVIDASTCAERDCPVVRVTADGVTLSGLTLQGGARPEGDGGGVTSWGAMDLRISACRITGNSAVNGGGVDLYSGWLDSSQVDHNQATAYGGGVWLNNGGPAVQVSNSVIDDNQASYGGGAYQYWRPDVVWTNNTIQDNSAKLGGGLFLHGDGPSSSGNQITANTATQTYDHPGWECGGGGVYNDSGDWSSSGDTISANSPDDVCPD